MTPMLTITIHEQAALEALNAMAAVLPISKLQVYEHLREAVQKAETEREQAARAAVIAEYNAAAQKDAQ